MQADSRRIRYQIHVLSCAEGSLHSSVLWALLRLGVFERIGSAGKSVHDLAAELGTRPDTLCRLLNAGVVLQLLGTDDGETFHPTAVSRSALLPSSADGYLGNWNRNLRYVWPALSRLDEAVLRSSPTADPSSHLGGEGSVTRDFILAMHDYAAVRGEELARYLDASGCRTLLDLGCGPGTYAFCLGLQKPELDLFLFDLPEVLDVAREVQARYALRNRLHYVAGDALKDRIPGPFDIVLVSNTLHMLGEKASRELLRRLHDSVSPGGSLVVQAQFLGDDRTGPRWPVMLDLIRLCITSHGRNHTVAETRQWMEQAGFTRIELRTMSVQNTNSFLRGYKVCICLAPCPPPTGRSSLTPAR